MNRDENYMQLAIDMAERTIGQTSPNPAVAAIVVNNLQVVGVGVHVKAGEPHAEVHALRMAGDKAKGATIYVTLEPCSHYGRTPPCSKAVIDAGIERVVIATQDPNPKVAGKGVEMLREAGLEVETGILKEKSDRLNDAFFHYIQSGEPYVYLKTAMSLDGKIATSTGESQWITGEEARQDGHTYRHRSDAILVGIGTVLADDPSLTTRLDGEGANPVRVIMDTNLKTPLQSKVCKDDAAPTILFTGNEVDPDRVEKYNEIPHVEVIQLSTPTVEVSEVLKQLGQKRITSLLVEGGGTVADAFVRAGKVNQLISYIAPKLIGGKEALTPLEGTGFQRLQDAMNLKVISTEMLGEDIKIIAIRKGG
ncbi:bifunctional diaminohydroxyphosphoribosylaminopyrimidine deaminase/5-amino-6-(5-phosphoribosylamino)uracil reductase RibD [Thalassobacillus hwangdonensis]|uniref:Riboflavin biosynthesis protein RibD n=1 Tax=Thalassobacillus hwangdonensis TaxID=546108 RepID=A0ABW3L218_9BACI